MDVVPVARPARVLDRAETAACDVAALEADRLEARPPEVRLEDEAVVPRPQEDAVVIAQCGLTAFILIDLSRNSLVYALLMSYGFSMPI